MAEPTRSSGNGNSSAVASVAIVVLVIVALIAGYFLFFQGTADGPAQPDIQIQLDDPTNN